MLTLYRIIFLDASTPRIQSSQTTKEPTMDNTVTPDTNTHGKVCYFVGHVGGRHDNFLDLGDDTGYTLQEPLLCPITGKELADHGHTDPNGNTGTLYCRDLEAADATLAWECFAGESAPDKDEKRAFAKWLSDLTDAKTVEAILTTLDWE